MHKMAIIAHWYKPKNLKLLVAEFSFAYGNKDEICPITVVPRAKRFFDALGIDGWYKPKAKTKTAYIYGDVDFDKPC